MTATPWWKCLNLRTEIVNSAGNINDVQMSLFRAVHEPNDTVYADVDYYSEITHPTSGLVELMGSIAVRLASPKHSDAAKAVWRGDQGMGGGKSHAQVGLYHMAHRPNEFFNTELGKTVLGRAESIAGESIPTDLGDPVVVVLPCDEMDPFNPQSDLDFDGPATTLGERWLWRLVEGDNTLFKRYRDDLGTTHGIQSAMAAVGRPVVTLVDEVLNYLRKATANPEHQERAVQDVAFLDDLMDATNKVDHAALVIVMIASDVDVVTMTEFGERFRTELEGKLTRYGRTIATTSGGDFADIIRRRLFTAPPPAEVLDAIVAEYQKHAVDGWREQFDTFSWWTDGFASRVARSYPFHPALVDLIEREWSQRAGFQRVRSTIQIFAASVWAWHERAKDGEWAPPLIGLGDLPLSDTAVRESLLNSGVIPDQKTVTNYREIASNDVVDPDDTRGAARRIDIERSEGLLSHSNPRAAERIATCMYLASLAPRAQGLTGATDPELRVAAFVPVPECDLGEIDAVISALEAPDRGIATLDIKPGKGGQPRRLVMSTSQTLQMFFRTQRQSVMPEDIAKVLRDEVQAEMKKGPFGKARFISSEGHDVDGAEKGRQLTEVLVAVLESAGLDEPENRLYVLDPSAFTLLNGVDSETRAALRAGFGLADSSQDEAWVPVPLSVVYASSCVFGVVNTQRRKPAVASATDYIAWQRVCEISNVASDESLLEQAQAEMRSKKEALRGHLRKAYQHVVYLNGAREVDSVRLDKENQTALDGALVWKVLAEAQKTFDKDEFTAAALMHNLRDNDFGKSLSSIRNDFYRSPRLPLLYDGDSDLKRALYEAYRQGSIVFLAQSGAEMEPTRPGDINITSTGIILDRPKPSVADENEIPEVSGQEEQREAIGTAEPSGKVLVESDQSRYGGGRGGEETVTLTLMGSAFASRIEQDAGYELFTTIAAAIDNAEVSFGKFSIELTLPEAIAAEIEGHLDGLGVSVNRRTV